MVGEAVEQRGGHRGVTEGGWPFSEGEVGGDKDRGAPSEAADRVEQELAAGLGEGEKLSSSTSRQASLLAAASLVFEAIDPINDVAGTASDAVEDEGAGDAIARWIFPVPVPPIRTTLCWSATTLPPGSSPTAVESTEYLLLSDRTVQDFATEAGTLRPQAGHEEPLAH